MSSGPRRGKDPFARVRCGAQGTVAWLDEHGDVRSAPASPGLTAMELHRAAQSRRGVKYQHRRHYEGYYWGAGTSAVVWFESMTEFTALMVLDHMRRLKHVVAQPMCLLYPDGSRHFPDFFLVDDDGTQTVVDVRPESRRSPRALAQFAATDALCEQIGWKYVLIGQLDPVVRANLECIAGYRHARYSPPPEVLDEVVARTTAEPCAFQYVASQLARGIPGRGIHFLYKLMWDRVLLFDMKAPLSDQTRLVLAT